jgi:cell wall-associated NlpC family hydrolase
VGRLAGVAAAGMALLSIAPASADARFGDRTLRTGMSGHDVKVLQSWLTHLGYETSIDGQFGSATRAALRRLEKKQGLRLDGKLDRSEARKLRRLLQAKVGGGGTGFSAPVGKASLSADGRTAVAPADAPPQVKQAIAAANAITRKPYRYGGGHGDFEDSGYDCSGAVSYALHGAGLLSRPMDSSELMRFGTSGAGKWITVYSEPSHGYVVIAGLRFDTSGEGEKGPRWRTERRSGAGYTVRHPAGL